MSFKSKAKTYEGQVKNMVKQSLKKANLGSFANITDFDCASDYGRRVFWKVEGKDYWLRFFAYEIPECRGGGVRFEYTMYTDSICDCGRTQSREYPGGETRCSLCLCKAQVFKGEKCDEGY
jgi:hypothetical protein